MKNDNEEYGRSVNHKGHMDDPYCPDGDTELSDPDNDAKCCPICDCPLEMKNLEDYMSITDTIVSILPDDTICALSILSVCIDTYAAHNGLKDMQAWDIIYQIAKQVHDEQGEMEDIL